MNKADLLNFFLPVIILFILINAVCFALGNTLNTKGIDHIVLLGANLLLFLLTLITCSIHTRSVFNNNPNAFVRGVMLSSFIKLMVIAASVVIYLIVADEKRSIPAIAIAMFFYILYTILEVKGAMRINREQNAKN